MCILLGFFSEFLVDLYNKPPACFIILSYTVIHKFSIILIHLIAQVTISVSTAVIDSMTLTPDVSERGTFHDLTLDNYNRIGEYLSQCFKDCHEPDAIE